MNSVVILGAGTFERVTQWMSDYANIAVNDGYLTALTVICLLQYGLQMYYRYHQKETDSQFRMEIDELMQEIQVISGERSLTRLENQILKNFVSETRRDRSLNSLLKHFAPNVSQGFSAFAELDHGTIILRRSRGLSEQSQQQLTIDADWIKRLANDEILHIRQGELYGSEFARSLAHPDRQKLKEIFIIQISDHQEEFGLIITTSLFPQGSSLPLQMELVKRVMHSVAANLHRTVILEHQQSELRSTQEMLALRAITDRDYDTPMKMVDDYLRRLSNMVDADRSLLYLVNSDTMGIKTLSRQGLSLQAGIASKWMEHEDQLALVTKDVEQSQALDRDALKNLGIDSLVGSALTIPMRRSGKIIGGLCLTRQDHGRFANSHIELAEWSMEFLAETLLKVMNRVVVEREARLDGLTKLANRRTFDFQIQREITSANESGQECSLILMDLDRFKSINDDYGHLVGDEVLRQFAKLLESESSRVRTTDQALVARYGGEEMAMILPGVGLQGTMRIAESIRAATENLQIPTDSGMIQVTVSCGVACYPRHAQSAEQLISSADSGLYYSKEHGRNQVNQAAEHQLQEA